MEPNTPNSLLVPRIVPIQIKTPLFQCQLCNSEFQTPLELRNHVAAELGIQPELYSFLELDLGITSAGDSSPDTRVSDFGPDKEVTCFKCSKTCKSERGFQQHYGKVHVRKKKHATCKLCSSSFRDKYALRFHIKQVHDQLTRAECPLCAVLLYNKYSIPKHILKCHPKSAY